MTDEQLQKLIDADDQGFLIVKSRAVSQGSVDERVLEIYQPIADFIQKNDFPPELNSDGQVERRLASQLAGLK